MILRCLILMSAACSVSGCTIVRLDGAKRVEHVGIGVLRIVPEDGVKVVSSKTRGFGIVPTTRGATIGYASEDVVFQYSNMCSVVIFELPKDERARQIWEKAISAGSNVCILGGEKK